VLNWGLYYMKCDFVFPHGAESTVIIMLPMHKWCNTLYTYLHSYFIVFCYNFIFKIHLPMSHEHISIDRRIIVCMRLG